MWSPQLIILQPTPYCNIACDYCYLTNRADRRLMSLQVVEAVRDKIFSRLAPGASATVVWHAGEPTTAPLPWYRSAYDVLQTSAPERTVFSIQSNGVALSDEWIAFLAETGTRIGLSIDGPQRFHDARRKTRRGKGTWLLATAALRRLQLAGFDPAVITVLHPEAVSAAEEFYGFYRRHRITQVSFSIDEAEGANLKSSFACCDHKPRMTRFLRELLDLAFRDEYPLHVREIERIARVLSGEADLANEQVEPWQVIVISASGDVTSFSPEFMEIRSATYNNFCFGNILSDDFDTLLENRFARLAHGAITRGTAACRSQCRYFPVCGGGAPVNKMFENGSLESTETTFCRLSIQAPADALLQFLCGKRPAAESANGWPHTTTGISPAQWRAM